MVVPVVVVVVAVKRSIIISVILDDSNNNHKENDNNKRFVLKVFVQINVVALVKRVARCAALKGQTKEVFTEQMSIRIR